MSESSIRIALRNKPSNPKKPRGYQCALMAVPSVSTYCFLAAMLSAAASRLCGVHTGSPTNSRIACNQQSYAGNRQHLPCEASSLVFRSVEEAYSLTTHHIAIP